MKTPTPTSTPTSKPSAPVSEPAPSSAPAQTGVGTGITAPAPEPELDTAPAAPVIVNFESFLILEGGTPDGVTAWAVAHDLRLLPSDVNQNEVLRYATAGQAILSPDSEASNVILGRLAHFRVSGRVVRFDMANTVVV